MSSNSSIWRFAAVACSLCWFLLTMSCLLMCLVLFDYVLDTAFEKLFIWDALITVVPLIPRVYPLRYFAQRQK